MCNVNHIEHYIYTDYSIYIYRYIYKQYVSYQISWNLLYQIIYVYIITHISATQRYIVPQAEWRIVELHSSWHIGHMA